MTSCTWARPRADGRVRWRRAGARGRDARERATGARARDDDGRVRVRRRGRDRGVVGGDETDAEVRTARVDVEVFVPARREHGADGDGARRRVSRAAVFRALGAEEVESGGEKGARGGWVVRERWSDVDRDVWDEKPRRGDSAGFRGAMLARRRSSVGERRGPRCSGDDDVVQQGRKSFPSGHTSMSFSGFVYCSLYLAAWLRIGREEGRAWWKLCVVLAPTVLALFVGLTRIHDYWHHWEDVVVGALLGTAFACASWMHKRPYARASTSDAREHTRKLFSATRGCARLKYVFLIASNKVTLVKTHAQFSRVECVRYARHRIRAF